VQPHTELAVSQALFCIELVVGAAIVLVDIAVLDEDTSDLGTQLASKLTYDLGRVVIVGKFID
jgi:hypothetical protein